MAKRKKRKAPRHRRSAKPKVEEELLDDELEGDEDIVDAEYDDEEDEAPAEVEPAAAKKPAAAAKKSADGAKPSKAAAKKSAATEHMGPAGVGYDTREAPASTGLWIMAFIFGLMLTAALAVKFLG